MIGQAGAGELTGREINANEERVVVRVILVPSLDLVAGLGEAPVADGQNQAALFGLGG